MKKFKIREMNYESFVEEERIELNLKLDVLGGFVGVNDVNRLKNVIESIDSDSTSSDNYVLYGRGIRAAQVMANDLIGKYFCKENGRFSINRVIFHNPATIVFWYDGTKTVVKCQDGDKFVPETGLAMCFMKKALGNQSNFNNTFKKWVKDKTIGDIFNELSKDEQKKITKYILSGPTSGRYEWKSDGKKKSTKTYAHLDTEAIYRILRENKWTVKELAKAVGVDHTSVYHWLRGGGIKKRTLSKMVKALHVSEEVLIKEEK